jgi:hypothetical protein
MLELIRRWPVLLLVLLLPLSACDTAAPRFGSVSVLLTDEPGEVTAAWVTITDIYLQGGGGGEDPPGGRVYLLQDGDETHELLSLRNTVAEVVRDAVVPAGAYGQLRVVMSGGCIVVDGAGVYASPGYTECGTPTGSLQMPSFAQSGARVLMHGFQVTGADQTILLDFNVAKTFGHQAGQSGMWVMNPVIDGAELHLAASVIVTLSAGDVELPGGVDLDQFAAWLTPAEGDVADEAFVDDGGVVRAAFRYLIADNGPFDLELIAPEGFTATLTPGSPLQAAPGPGQTATVEWVLSSVVAD